ncbi:MAG: patatin-like phospholipase family protein [Devosiaceae bacterium]|nr:patatin-like phospholipase family protein [Devosiaceae bacterium MH13]
MTIAITADTPPTSEPAGDDLPKLGLALGGGGARGLAHIVVLELIEELGLPVACIAGTSIGSIMGWGKAASMPAGEMREWALTTFLDGREVATRAWRIRPKRWEALRGMSMQLDADAILSAFLPASLPERFEDLSTPLAVVTTDYYGWTSHTIKAGAIRPAVAASIAIPFVFKPRVLNGRVHVDGGVVNPLPTGALGACDMVVAVDVIGGPEPQGENAGDRVDQPPSQMESILGATQLCMQTITKAHLDRHPPDVLITPPIANFPALNFLKTREVLAAADSHRDLMRRQLSEGVERWLRQT